MNISDLIDDYLTNRLNEQEREAFEKQMASDPALKTDVDLQREIVSGLKAARMAELKAMLKKVPVATPTIYFTPLRIAAGLIGTAVLAAGLYFIIEKNGHFNVNQMSSSLVDSINQAENKNPDLQPDSSKNEMNIAPILKEKAVKEVIEQKKDAEAIDQNSKGTKPSIDVIDPTGELTETEPTPENTSSNSPAISLAKIDAEVNSSERKFKSHYKFSQGKLVLYGAFDKGLYEIIEVNAQTSRTLFLFYKSSYYFLDETQKEVTLLKEITDPLLLDKLEAFRSNK